MSSEGERLARGTARQLLARMGTEAPRDGDRIEP
jgi:hypothetical protein